VEVALQAVVDPYFRGDIFLGVSDLEGIAIEQAYLTTTSLPHQLEARLGRFLMPFGKQNTTHRHDLHTIEYPYVIQRSSRPRGSRERACRAAASSLRSASIRRSSSRRRSPWRAPEDLSPAESVNEEIDGLGYSARLRNYVDVSEAANVELSFSR
jgi:hypothetical protein